MDACIDSIEHQKRSKSESNPDLRFSSSSNGGRPTCKWTETTLLLIVKWQAPPMAFAPLYDVRVLGRTTTKIKCNGRLCQV